MKPIVIRYSTKSERTQENAQLIEGVFRELDSKRPDGVRYLVLRLEDDSFVHLVSFDGEEEALTSLPAFGTFRNEAPEFRSSSPVRLAGEVVGNYRMLAEQN